MAATPARAAHKFQAPKGTRDFFPADMAVRRHIESVWRDVSVDHGFEEIDGPTFEHLELYTVKSGPGIVSELFSFRREGGDADYALRPEFTPTLARMVAARAAQLPKPVKWFSIPAHFRAERPQRGRLREFLQWNADICGDPSPRADAELIALAADVLARLGLGPDRVRIKLSHRGLIGTILAHTGFGERDLPALFDLLDRRDRLSGEEVEARAREHGLDPAGIDRFLAIADETAAATGDLPALIDRLGIPADAAAPLLEVSAHLRAIGLDDWHEIDLGIVRGLAYYTGTVFEIHEAAGRERAMAGGGRYDGLVQLFGGPPTPAAGFAMGDVVLRLVLEDHHLLDEPETYLPRPDAFVIAADGESGTTMVPLIADLRRRGLHVRHSSRATRNVGKLLGEASRCRSRFAVILGKETGSGRVTLKDLGSGEQDEVALADLATALERGLAGRSM